MSDDSVASAPDATSASAPMVRGHALRGWRLFVLWPLGWLLRLWGHSLRFEIDPADKAALSWHERPAALVIWHNRLFIAGEIRRRYRDNRNFYGLISASRDGAWLAGFFRMMGISAVRGSSSRGAREAVSALIDVLRAGQDIGITPDGPRGPCYDFKPGGLIVARRVGAPLLLIGGSFDSAWRLRSWDRFYIPRPFSRVTIRCIRMDPADLPRDREAALALLAEQLRSLNPERSE